MAGCAVLSAVGAGLAITALRHLNSASVAYLRVVAAVDHIDAADQVGNLHGDLVLHAVLGVVGLVTLAPLSVAVRRPRPIARVGAWISALVLSAGLALVLASSPESLVSPDGFEAPEVRKALADLLFGWYPSVTSVLTAIQIAAMLTFSLLLLRTTSSDFYRPQDQGPTGLWTFARQPDST
jgi:hypothetical protein